MEGIHVSLHCPGQLFLSANLWLLVLVVEQTDDCLVNRNARLEEWLRVSLSALEHIFSDGKCPVVCFRRVDWIPDMSLSCAWDRISLKESRVGGANWTWQSDSSKGFLLNGGFVVVVGDSFKDVIFLSVG